MRRPLVMGNWKMNGTSGFNEQLINALSRGLNGIAGVDLAVCPPALYLQQVNELCRNTPIRVGAQNMSQFASGAYTGEVSADMLRDLDICYVILGHSERRALFGETDEQIAAKVEAALERGLVPVLCVGETLEQRKRNQTKDVIKQQVSTVLDRCTVSSFAQIVLAYEPVWAIGTGETASPSQAQEIHRFIRELIAAEDPQIAQRCTLLYGGSVNEKNAKALFSMPDVDGGLVGGASLKAESFLGICSAAAFKASA